MRRHILVITLTAALGIASLAAQGGAHFSTQSDLVVLDVSVTDGRGGFVGGLPLESFKVFEDGRPQEVSFFAQQDASEESSQPNGVSEFQQDFRETNANCGSSAP